MRYWRGFRAVLPSIHERRSPGIRMATFPLWRDARHYTRLPTTEHEDERMIACWRGVFTDFGPYAVKNTANPKIRWMTVSQQEGRRRMAIAPRGMGPHYGMMTHTRVGR